MIKPYKLISTKLIHQGWLNLRKDIVKLPNGKLQDYTYAEAPDGVVVLALNEKNEVLLVEQYRVPLKKVLVELVAGRCDKGEDPKHAAKRELEEETGYQASKVIFLGTVYPTVGQMNFTTHIFFAKELKFVGQKLDDTEFLDNKTMPLEEFKQKILECKLETSMILAYYLAKEKGLI